MPTGQRTFRYGTQAEDAVLRALWLLKRYFLCHGVPKADMQRRLRHGKETESGK